MRMEINTSIFNVIITHVALSAKWAACAFIIMQLAALLISMLLKRNPSGKLCMTYN